MPLGESMISSLKSNKSIKLDKSSRFKKTLGGYGKNKSSKFDFPEATPELLVAIQLKIKKNYNRNLIVSSIVFISFFAVGIYLLYHFNII